MKIKVGNKVKIVNEDFEGIVKQVLLNNRVVITCTDGFDYEKPMHEVVVILEDNTHSYTIEDADVIHKLSVANTDKWTSTKNVLSSYINSSKYSYQGKLEIDLHLEELVEFPQRLEDWEKLHTQMKHVKKCLNAAFEKKIKSIVFIHGVGTGVLKTELINLLSTYENVIIKDADSREYGMGATEVLIQR